MDSNVSTQADPVPGKRTKPRKLAEPAQVPAMPPLGAAPVVVASESPKGRPSKFTAENQAAILANLAAGLHYEDALAAIPDPIDYSTFAKWRQDSEARGETSPYFDFFQQAKQAELTAKRRHVQRIEDASERDWHASGWILARRWPEQWADQSRRTVQHTGSVQVQHVHTLALPAPGDWGQLAGLLGLAEPAIDTDAREVAGEPTE
jgi:hypothetical protein